MLTIWLVQRGSSESKKPGDEGRGSDEEQPLSWCAQAVTGRVAENQQRMRDLLDPIGLGDYVAGPDFWSRTLQNWQSEMLALGSMAVFAIYVRERGSPESKPLGMPHDVTTSDD